MKRRPVVSHILPGMACDVEKQAEAAMEYQAEELTAEMLKPLGDINTATGELERRSPLFFGTGDNPLVCSEVRAMTIQELLKRANAGYPDEGLASYYDEETGKKERGSGDSLAQFVAWELIETFDDSADDEEQTAYATAKLETAIRELQGVIDALDSALTS